MYWAKQQISNKNRGICRSVCELYSLLKEIGFMGTWNPTQENGRTQKGYFFPNISLILFQKQTIIAIIIKCTTTHYSTEIFKSRKPKFRVDPVYHYSYRPFVLKFYRVINMDCLFQVIQWWWLVQVILHQPNLYVGYNFHSGVCQF